MLPTSVGQQSAVMTKPIDEIPLDKRKNICTEIDFSITQRNGYWDRLVSELGFTESDSKSFQLAFAKNQSPTENLLRECGYRNYKIGKLCTILKRIGLVKLAEENLDNLGEKHVAPIGHLQWVGGAENSPRRPTESDSTNSSHSGSDGDKIGGLDTIHYPYSEIEKGTNHFSRNMKLGAGAFGKVYKVNLKNTIFACKVLTINSDSPHFSIVSKHKEQSDLKNELRFLAEYRHPNIIPLYGWSLDGKDPCLIYQYMKNGSLQDCLQRLKGNKPLSWVTRIKVACDAARGLQFLHEAKEKPLIHGDIKTANILLDDSFVAKLGDFGLAREGPRSHVTGSYVRLNDEHTPGTMGYLAVEYMQSKKLSVQVDTYAFGVVLLELYTGRRAYDRTQKKAGTLLRDYMDDIANGMGEGGPKQAEDRLFEHQSPEIEALPREIALKLVRLALACCHEKRNKRPAMSAALERLEALRSEVENLPQLMQEPMFSTSSSMSSVSRPMQQHNFDRREWLNVHSKPLDSRYDSQQLSRTPVESVDLSFLPPSRSHHSHHDQSNNVFLTPPAHVPLNEALKQASLNENPVHYPSKPPPHPQSFMGGFVPTTHQYVYGPMYPHPMIAMTSQPHSPLQWVGDPNGANHLSPMLSIPMPPMSHHQMGPFPPYTPNSPFSPQRYSVPYGGNMLNVMRMPPSTGSDEGSDPKLSQSTTPISPSTPGMLSTPEAFSSFELDQLGSGHSPQPQVPTGNSNGVYSSSPNLNPFLYPHSPTAPAASYHRSAEVPAASSSTAPFTSQELYLDSASPISVPVKVNPAKAEMLERLSKLKDTTDDSELLTYLT